MSIKYDITISPPSRAHTLFLSGNIRGPAFCLFDRLFPRIQRLFSQLTNQKRRRHLPIEAFVRQPPYEALERICLPGLHDVLQ